MSDMCCHRVVGRITTCFLQANLAKQPVSVLLFINPSTIIIQTDQAGEVQPMLVQCWVSVKDDRPSAIFQIETLKLFVVVNYTLLRLTLFNESVSLNFFNNRSNHCHWELNDCLNIKICKKKMFYIKQNE